MIVQFYTLSSSRNPNNIRYVGKTISTLSVRLSLHIHESKRKLKDGYTHNHKCNWINKELRDGYNIIIESIDSIDDLYIDWLVLENMWISLFKSWGFDLVNLTSGGDGVNNLILSEESNLKRSLALLGTHRPEEVKLKISKSKMSTKLTEKTKQKISEKIIEILGKKILQFDKVTGQFIKEWRCIKEAADFYNTDPSNIMNCCKRTRNRKTAVGYIWKYSNDKSEILIDKSRYIYCIYDNYVLECINLQDAILKTGISKKSIIDCLKKRKESCKGVVFLYRLDYLNSEYTNIQLIN